MRAIRLLVFLAVLPVFLGGCFPNINLFSGPEPLAETVLQGSATPKIVVIPIRGVISDSPEDRMIMERPSMLEEVVAKLRKAGEDPSVGAVVLKIDSPGGSITASDVLFHEIERFREKSGAKVVAAFMGLAASGGYYVALAADRIVAHPTTVTGSVGVIFMQPRLMGLMDKIGVGVETHTAGRNKDMGSPFREPTQEEEKIVQDIVASMGDRFLGLVKERRGITGEALETVGTARIFTAGQALGLGLVDKVGYLEDALATARELASLPEDAKVVVYRRREFPDDNIYNDATMRGPGKTPSLAGSLGLPKSVLGLSPGFYYLWTGGLAD
ncbi:MAG: signal peptide peptidase SppA [Proteobacteria bacterium]|nr:signal peptide peptidase SppA [Pseudomonadota bacterium]